MSPNSTLATGMATQNRTKMNVGARLAVCDCAPASPAQTTTPNSAMPIRPHRTSTIRGTPSTRHPVVCSSRGDGHRIARATNEMTSTDAAAQPKTHGSIGRSSRPTMP